MPRTDHPPMTKNHSYKFCFGPWNISEGADPYGPPTRSPQSFG
jgi:xylose isomerase